MFEYVRPYRRSRDEFLGYLHSPLVLLDDGDDLRLMSTDRLNEQWVFFRIAAGLRAAGLRVTGEGGVFHRFRVTAVLDRGACLTFRAAGGRVVRLRYEPWNYSYSEAQARGDTIYKTPWTGTRPDGGWDESISGEFGFPG